MKKVLLLNPPGKKIYIREYFCSKVSQADYIPPPVDLVMLSGILSREYELDVIDAIADKLSPEETLSLIRAQAPYAVISLLGSVSFEEDQGFIAQLRTAIPSALLVGIGDLFNEAPEAYFKEKLPQLDAVLMDFTSDDVLAYLRGDTDKITTMLLKGGKVTRSAAARLPQPDMPAALPRHDLFARHRYRYPFARSDKFSAVLTDYGCPFKCSFCIMSTLAYKKRTVEDIIAELKSVLALGIREVLFVTQTFGANRPLALELCRRIVEEKMPLSWSCFSRVDVASPELLSAMKLAGCHTIIFGIESGSEKILKHYQKGYTVKQITDTLDYCASIDIETVGTFILGLPEEDRSTMAETMTLLKAIRLDYASFNVAVPRVGTPLRGQAVADGLVDKDFSVMDQSGSVIAMPTKYLSRKEIEAFRRAAVRSFCLRPAYILNRLWKINSFERLLRHIRQGLHLLLNTWVKR